MNVGSLFSGIGGLDLGLERAGMRVVWQVEIDPYARAVLGRRFPAATLYADVRHIGAGVPFVDVLCGGFPCQDISDAGLRVGIGGEQSGLWAEYARIIRALRPRYVLVENVAALLDRGMGRVLGDLAACGFDAEWDCLPAFSVGSPHVRDRLFLVAYPERERRREGRAEPDAGRQASIGGSGENVPDPESERIFDGRWIEREGGREEARRLRFWRHQPEVVRVADGVPARVDRLRCVGNAVVPQVAEWLGRRILAHAKATQMIARPDTKRPQQPPKEK